MTYKYLCLFALYCSAPFVSLSAQDSDVHRASLYITYDLENEAKKKGQIALKGDEAYNFDVVDFLLNSRRENIKVFRSASLDGEKQTWTFDSAKEQNAEGCAAYKSVVLETEALPFLGVSAKGNEDFTGVVVTKIVEESAAQTYGLQVGDIINMIDGYGIYTNCDLTGTLNEFEPGDLLEIDLIRAENPQTVEVILGQRAHKKMTWAPDCSPQIEVTEAVIAAPETTLDFTVFPNPTSGKIRAVYTSDTRENLQLTITDLAGRVVYSEKNVKFSGFYSNMIDLEKFENGIYFLNVKQGEEVQTRKVVLEKI